ncbi:TonB-dependent receptor [Pseudozobellia sp. WGM2]|uniref:SusC/RagA family TonB-linked outer membrane protein n=1 Tax=Pseudozobellia sp. WGM2 TaxID=2787625 RepID=UPI001AE07F8F|nr:TonB-dependent receptor [Pseudozobellia sp. WGM2]
METRLIKGCFQLRKRLLLIIMRTFIFLCCATIFAITPSNLLSQHSKVKITADESLTVDEVFDLIMEQTEYKFFYEEGIFKDFPKVQVKKGRIRTNMLLKQSLANGNLNIEVTTNNAILISEKSPNSLLESPQNKEFQNNISGTITDQNNQPLPGANILEKGTTNGTQADFDGNFSLELGNNNATLVISYIGFATKEVLVNEQTTVNVQLIESSQGLDEVVVVGYGTVRKSDLTGSVGSVNAKTLEKRQITNVGQALSGRVTGLDVSINSGKPGNSPTITIRGATSVSNTNSPLFVVDGVIMGMESLQGGISPINTIDPNSIESIQVLKDASSTAIYGARGANGVILITTKRGSTEPRVSYNGYTSISTVSRRMDLMNAAEYLKVEDIAYQNAAKFDPVGFANGKFIDPKIKRESFMIGNDKGNPVLFDANLNPLYDTDWQEEAFQTAIAQNHNLSFTGGNEQTRFGIYTGYRDEDGVMKNTWLNRYSLRFVIDSKINNWLSVGGNINYNKESQRFLSGWGMRAVYQSIPIIPVKWPDGTWAKNGIYPGEGPNQRQVAEEDNNFRNTQNTVGNLFTEIEFIKDLKLKTMVAANVIRQETNRYSGRNVDWISENQGGIASISSLQAENWQFENLLSYALDINDKHFVAALLGQSLTTTSSFSSGSSSYDFIDDYFLYNNLGIGSNPRPPSSSANEYSMASFFGRVNYTLSNKYLLTATGRIDGSSKFGKNNRFAFFPSSAIGWIASKEDFLKDNPVISFLKLRTSFGMTGNSEILNYQYEAGLGQYTAIFNGNRSTSIGISTLSNPNLKWEVNTQTDIGLEVGLFDGRISLEADIYRRVSKDMLLNKPVPQSSGYTTVTENVGSMRNQGLELALSTYNISKPDFSWSTDFNLTINENKVLKLAGGSDILLGSVPGGTPGSIVREGLPVNTFIGYVRLGTWSTDEAEEAAKYQRRPGDIKYKDVNNDNAINSQDWLPIGNGLPAGYGTLVNTFTYKSFELSADIQFVYGNDVMWEITQVLQDRTGAYNNMVRNTLYDAWTPENQNTYIAQNKPLSVGYDTKNDTYRLKDGSFIRGRNFTLSYNLPHELVNRWRLSNLRVYTSAQNLFTISKFPGYDPEVSTTDGQFTRGRSAFNDYPKAKTFTVGIQVDL